MSKYLLIPNSKNIINNKNINGIIIGIKGLSVNLPIYFNLEETIQIINSTDKEIFVSLNKNMHNSDLNYLKEVLLKLEKTNVKAVLYYDISIVNIKEELNLNLELVWSQEHMTTNFYTANYWNSKKVNYVYLSSEITKEEIKNIKENTNMKLLVSGFGYVPMFNSKRNLVNNYLRKFNLRDNSKINYLSKEGKIYPITHDEETTVYTDKVINCIGELKQIDVDYIVINTFNIEEEKVNSLLSLINNDINRIDDLFETDKYFTNVETFYKVKKND